MNLSIFFFALSYALQGGAMQVPAKYSVKEPASNAVIATVDGTEIKASDINDLLWDLYASQTADEMIGYIIVKNKADKLGYSVTNEEVEKVVDAQLAELQKNLQEGQSLDAALRQRNLSKASLFIRMRSELLLQKVIAHDLKPAEMAKVSTMVFPVKDSSAETLSVALRQANNAYERLQNKAPWENVLLSTTNEDHIIKSKGLLGWRDIGAFPESVREEFRKGAGTITKPVQTQNGLQIFRLEMLGKDAKGDELKNMTDFYVASKRQEVLRKLYSEAKVERKFPGK